jgi:hypothetical protein
LAYVTTREFDRRVQAPFDALPDRDIEPAIAVVAQDGEAPVEVRLAALHRLQGDLTAKMRQQCEAQGVRLTGLSAAAAEWKRCRNRPDDCPDLSLAVTHQ